MDPFAAARAALPWWVGWLPVVYPFLGGILLFGLSSLTVRLLSPRASEVIESWTERARRWFPARRIAALFLWSLPAFIAVTLGGVGPLSRVPANGLGLLGLLAGLAGTFAVVSQVELRARPFLTRTAIRRGTALDALLLTDYAWLAIAVAVFMPSRPFKLGIAFAALWLAGTYVQSWLGVGRRLAGRLGLIQPAGERLARIVQAVAAELRIPMSRAVEVDWHMAMAFAFPGKRIVAFSRPALPLLSDEEVAAVVRHELGHLNEPRSLHFKRSVFAIAPFLGIVLGKPMIAAYGFLPWLGILGGLFLVSMKLRETLRRAETHADDHAGDQKPALDAALLRLYEYNLVPAVLPKLMDNVHPDLPERVANQAEPLFAKPPEPPRYWPAVVAFLAITAIVPFSVGAIGAYLRLTGNPSVLTLAVAATGGAAHPLGALATAIAPEDPLRAAALYMAAAKLDAPLLHNYFHAVQVLASAKRCEPASSLMADRPSAWSEKLSDAHDQIARRNAMLPLASCSAKPDGAIKEEVP